MATGVVLRITDTRSSRTWERRFERFPVRIGRSRINDLRLDHGFVSQYHAVLELHSASLMLRDLGSTNGTILRGEGRVPPNQLIDLGVGQRNHSFAIVSLDIHAFPIYVDQALAGATLALGDTVDARPTSQGPGGYVDSLNERDAALDHDYQAYRLAWARLHQRFHHELRAVEPPLRARFFQMVMRTRPEMAAEPEFDRLAAEFGVTIPPNESAQALQGLRALAARYLPSRPLSDARSTSAFLTKLRTTLDVFFECFIPLRDGYQEFRASMAVRKPDAANRIQAGRIDAAKTPDELADCMLDWTRNTDDAGAVAGTFADVMIHHIAMLNGVMMGVNCLLNELSPTTIAHSCERRTRRSLLGRGPSHKVLWASFIERFSDLADEQNETFRLVFGPDFASAYQRFQQEASQAREGSLAAPSLAERARMAHGDNPSSAFVPVVPNPNRK